jgi:biotin carboxylase
MADEQRNAVHGGKPPSCDRCKHVFILGHDQKHQQDVEQVYSPEHYCTHPLLHSDELINQDDFDFDKMLNKARGELAKHEHVDGIICHWDFPVTSMHAILCEEFNVPGPSLTSLLKCEHKYWSRLEQRKVVPENTPGFCAVDPFDDQALEKLTLDFPFWLKPIKGYGSVLGFHVGNEEDFKQAIAETREQISALGDPFSKVLARLDLPEELQGINGNAMIAEQFVHGHEFAPEGYVQNGECHIHGLIDMVIGANGKSFERYEYPSTAPSEVQERAKDVCRKIMKQIGFDNGCFNIEFFWDAETDDLWVIEVNPRISQSHSYLFEKVNGLSNHEIAFAVALGEEPHFDGRHGPYNRAAKFLHRRYDKENLVATRIPEQPDIEAFQNRQPDTLVYPRLEKGMELAQMKEQDPYSYVIADILIAAQDREELEEKYRVAAEQLPFEFSPIGNEPPRPGH